MNPEVLKKFQSWAIANAEKADNLTGREAKLTWALGLVDEAIRAEELVCSVPENLYLALPGYRLALLSALRDVVWYIVVEADVYQINVEAMLATMFRIIPLSDADTFRKLVLAARELGELVKEDIGHGHTISKSELTNWLSIVLWIVLRQAIHMDCSADELLRIEK